MTKLVAKAEEALGLIKTAVAIRAEITEHYSQYRALTDIAVYSAGVSHADVKKAVDALYYLGGGWPTPNSKGRMEALLDSFAGMYRVLDFIGSGQIVRDHLAQYGISVSLAPEHQIKNHELTPNEIKYLDNEYSSAYFNLDEITDLKTLIAAIVEECQELQRQICKKADIIKEELRPAAKTTLGVEDAEYDRLHDFVKLSINDDPRSEEKAISKRATINTSLSSFNIGMTTLGAKNGR
jgi:hypothetical protein